MRHSSKLVKTLGRTGLIFGAFFVAHFSASAQTAGKYMGDIFMFGGSYCPPNSEPANGQIIRISDNQGLFSLIGTKFGGNGQSTFALPDLRSRTPVGAGQGPGLMPIGEGERGGLETITLAPANLTPHTHNGVSQPIATHDHLDAGHAHSGTIKTTDQTVSEASPNNALIGTFPGQARFYSSEDPSGDPMAAGTVTVNEQAAQTTQSTVPTGPTGPAGNSSPIDVRSFYTALQFCIVTQGTFPPRP